MLLCRRWFLLHRGMGDCESPMSCLIICLVAVIIPRFPRIDKSFLWGVKIISVGKRTPQSRFACQLPFQGSLFVCCTSKASPEKGGGPLAVERFCPHYRTRSEHTGGWSVRKAFNARRTLPCTTRLVRSTMAAGFSFMPLSIHSSITPVKACS